MSGRWRSTATATPCWSGWIRPAAPAIPATAPASTRTCCWAERPGRSCRILPSAGGRGDELGPGLPAVGVLRAGVQPVGEPVVQVARPADVEDVAAPAGPDDAAEAQHLGPAEVGRPARRVAVEQLGGAGRYLGGGHALEASVQRQRSYRPAAQRAEHSREQL